MWLFRQEPISSWDWNMETNWSNWKHFALNERMCEMQSNITKLRAVTATDRRFLFFIVMQFSQDLSDTNRLKLEPDRNNQIHHMWVQTHQVGERVMHASLKQKWFLWLATGKKETLFDWRSFDITSYCIISAHVLQIWIEAQFFFI